MRALVFNCGSSSLKFELAELDEAFRRVGAARGKVESIGARGGYSFVGMDGKTVSGEREFADHKAAALFGLSWLESIRAAPGESLDTAAHRVVHGGDGVTEARIVDEEVMAALERASAFAPLHNPPAIEVVRAVQARLGGVPSVVLPDTAFHQTLTPAARAYALPYEMAQRLGIRRFGFHGIGHAWMMERYAEIAGKSAAALNLVTFHLGAGCSACAILNGRSVDTSMGMTPLEGLVMATRAGDLDPAIVSYLLGAANLSRSELDRMLNRESGLLGVSGVSADMREVRGAAGRGDKRAQLALAMFVHRLRKYLGAYVVTVGPPHAIAFGGGIGEHDAELREQALGGLEWMGIEIDSAANRSANPRELQISSKSSRIAVWVIPLDEELYIARAALKLVKNRRSQTG